MLHRHPVRLTVKEPLAMRTLSQPLNVDNLTAETFMWRQRGGNINYISGSTLKTYSQPSNKTTNTGFDAFKLKDVEYGVIPTELIKPDGFLGIHSF